MQIHFFLFLHKKKFENTHGKKTVQVDLKIESDESE